MPGIYLAPSSGMRTFLLIMLGLSTVFTGLLTLFGLIGETSPTNDSGTTGVVLFTAFLVMFGVSAIALLGVANRASWSRVAAFAAGVVVSLSCIGLVLGIPIIVAAARTPNPSRQKS
jgi:cytochrome c biogenesis protein CcdA